MGGYFSFKTVKEFSKKGVLNFAWLHWFLQHLTVNRLDLQNHLRGLLETLIYCFPSCDEL